MPTSIDWGTKVITINRADLLQVQVSPIAVYELNVNDFRLELSDLLDDPAGIPFPDTHQYNPPVTVAGVTLARVFEIINGYTVTFSPDLSYGVNVIGGNSNVADVTNPNNVSVRSANSAGLQDAESLQVASFNGAISMDQTSPYSGTTFPRGTRQFPVNNLADALAIASNRGIATLDVIGTNVLSTETLYPRIEVVSSLNGRNNVVVLAGTDVTGVEFQKVTVTGTVVGGNNIFRECGIIDMNNVSGMMLDCAMLEGYVYVAYFNPQVSGLALVNCYSVVPADSLAVHTHIDMGGFGNSMLIRNYSGGIGLTNYTGGGDITIDMSSGLVHLGGSVTAGLVTIRGIAEVLDDSTGTAEIVDRTNTNMIDTVPGKIIPHIWAAS